MTTRYSTALSHIVLAGTGLYCYLCTQGNPTVFAKASFGCIVLNSVIGIWRWGNPVYGPSASKLYGLTSLLQDSLVLPSIIASVWLQYGYLSEIAYAFIVASVLPIVTELASVKKNLLNTVVAVRCLTLGILSLVHENYFGVAASLSYAFNHFVIREDHETFFNVTSRDLYNYAMCFFAVFSLRTVLD